MYNVHDTIQGIIWNNERNIQYIKTMDKYQLNSYNQSLRKLKSAYT